MHQPTIEHEQQEPTRLGCSDAARSALRKGALAAGRLQRCHESRYRPLPSHLDEVCRLLVRGLLRLLSHTRDDVGGEARVAASRGESSLHIAPHRSGHAKPRDKELA
jgi:hypothetical protein